jgi:hypothetical protein
MSNRPDIANARHLLRLLAQGNVIQKTPANREDVPDLYLWTLAGEPLRRGCLSQLLRASYVVRTAENDECFAISEYGKQALKQYERENRERNERKETKRKQARYREIEPEDDDPEEQEGET